jgi:alcohol dehydrogenase (cytochrome c)
MPKHSRQSLQFAFALSALTLLSARPEAYEVSNFIPVDPADWLMFSRTYDAQRYSPLEQINKHNIKDLRMAWSRGMDQGRVESIPLVYDGIICLLARGAQILALDATNGDTLWSYQGSLPAPHRAQALSKTIAIYGDMIYHTAPDGYVIVVDARTGELR